MINRAGEHRHLDSLEIRSEKSDQEHPPLNRSLLNLIKGTPFFYDLTQDEFNRISRKTLLHRLKPRTTVLLEKERRDSLFFVIEGRLKGTILHPDTKEHIVLYDFSKGSFFGEVSLLTGRLNPVSISTLSECELLEIPGALYKSVGLKYSSARGFLINLHQQHTEKISRTLNSYKVDRRKLTRTPFDGSVIFQRFEPGSKEKIIKVGRGRLIDVSETGVAFYLERRHVTCRFPEMLNREYKAKISAPDSSNVKFLGKVVGLEFNVRGEKFYDCYIARMTFLVLERSDRASLRELLGSKRGSLLLGG